MSCRLPQIQEELEKSITKARIDLARLPRKPSDDPRSEISALLHKFASDLGRHVEGLPQVIGTFESSGDSNFEKGLIQSVNTAQQLFRIEIRSTAPNFQPFEQKDAQSKHLSPAYFLRSEEGDQCEDETSDVEDETSGSEDETSGLGDEASDLQSGLEDEDHYGLSASQASSFQTRKNISGSLQPKVYIDEVLEAAQRYVCLSDS